MAQSTVPLPAMREAIAIHRKYAVGSVNDARLDAFWIEVNAHLARKSEPEANFYEAVWLLDDGETSEGAAEWIEGQRWLARTERAA